MASKASRNKATSPSRNKSAGGEGTPKKPARKAASKPKAKRSRPKAQPARTPTEDTSRVDKEPTPPFRAQREGTRRHHSRELTSAESKKRQEREVKRREEEEASQKAHRKNLQKQGKGWGGARAARGAQRGR